MAGRWLGAVGGCVPSARPPPSLRCGAPVRSVSPSASRCLTAHSRLSTLTASRHPIIPSPPRLSPEGGGGWGTEGDLDDLSPSTRQ